LPMCVLMQVLLQHHEWAYHDFLFMDCWIVTKHPTAQSNDP
jgi:hypothetical protein